MRRTLRRPPLCGRLGLPALLALAVGSPAAAVAPAPPAPTPSGGSPVAGSPERDAELARRLDSLLAEADPGPGWSVSIEAVGEKDRLVHRIFLWGDGIGIWDNESQFRLEPPARREILRSFRDQGFCRMNDDLFQPGSGLRGSPGAPVQQQAIKLQIGGVTKTVTHTVPSLGRYRDVEEAARPLREIVRVARTVCEGPASRGIRASDLADGLSKVEARRLADVAVHLFVNRLEDSGAHGWLVRVDGRRVTTQVSTKGKGWAPPVEIRLPDDEFLELVRSVSAARPGAFPKNLYDEGYTDLTLSVLNRSVNVQARPFSGMDPKAQEEIRRAFRAVVVAARKMHEKALLEGKGP